MSAPFNEGRIELEFDDGDTFPSILHGLADYLVEVTLTDDRMMSGYVRVDRDGLYLREGFRLTSVERDNRIDFNAIRKIHVL